MSIGLYVGTTESDFSMEGLFDLDFTQNEEYFREDTLSLGYRNEADRIIKENKNEDGSYNIEEIVRISMASDFYKEYQLFIKEICGNKIITIAYTT